MKKPLLYTFIIILLLLAPEEALAKTQTSTPDLIKANLDETPPFFGLEPVPTPEKQINKEKTGDSRSWTRFKHSHIIKETSEKYSLDPQLIYATIMTESHGNEYAYRFEPHINDSSLGMGQILTKTARSIGFTGDTRELYKPEVSIDLIGKYYRYFLDRFGELNHIQLVKAYNTGSPYKRPTKGHLTRFEMFYYENMDLTMNPSKI